MALESVIIFGENQGGNPKSYKVVDCSLDIHRPYDKCSPTGFTRLENLEVTVSPPHGDTFFHKWFTKKTRETVTLKIVLINPASYAEESQEFQFAEAFCHSLSETFDKAGKKGDALRRLLKVGIKARSIKLDDQQLRTYVNKKKADRKEDEPAFVAKNQANDALIRERAAEMRGNLTEYEKLRLAEHSIAIEAALGRPKGRPMTIEEAQKANPRFKLKNIPNTERKVVGTYIVMEKDKNGNVVEREIGYVPRKIRNPQWNEATDRQYTINCATCSTAYALRLQGFDVTAKGKCDANDLNEKLSHNKNMYKVWKNADGTKAEPTLLQDWMKENGVYKMTPALYKEYFEENTQEEGTYLISVGWPGEKGKNRDGHATIVERWRDEDGNLHLSNVEPQHYGDPAKKDMNKEIYSAATPWPRECDGIMRVDNKLFDTSKIGLFE